MTDGRTFGVIEIKLGYELGKAFLGIIDDEHTGIRRDLVRIMMMTIELIRLNEYI